MPGSPEGFLVNSHRKCNGGEEQKAIRRAVWGRPPRTLGILTRTVAFSMLRVGGLSRDTWQRWAGRCILRRSSRHSGGPHFAQNRGAAAGLKQRRRMGGGPRRQE